MLSATQNAFDRTTELESKTRNSRPDFQMTDLLNYCSKGLSFWKSLITEECSSLS